MQKKLSVSIGIPAHNEAGNIKKVLGQILKQKRENWILSEILVYCDGCTDSTYNEAKKVKNTFITVFDDGKRKGKTKRLAQMFSEFKGDFLIMLDADVRLYNKKVISNLLQGFENRRVVLVGGNSRPITPRTFFEKAVATTFNVFYQSRRKINGGNNIYGCTGSILAIRRKLAKSVRFPKVINEDAYLYLYCKSKGYDFRYIDDAVVEYKLPTKISDYIKQTFRSEPLSVTLELGKYFGNMAKKEFNRPLKFYIKAVAFEFIRNPVGVLLIAGINLICRPIIPFVQRNYKLEWFTAHSTK